MSEQDSKELKKPVGNDAPESRAPEDAGTQALADALRSSFFIIQIVMVLLVCLFFGSGFFTVDAQHKAILLRLGRPVGQGESALLGPGLHFAFPRPIDEKVMVAYTSSQHADSTVGWYQTVAERLKGAPEPQAQTQMDPATISYALTADTNIIHVMATARYRITDPIKFTFNFADAAVFVTNDLNNALLLTASHFTVDEALTTKPAEFKEAVETRMRALATEQDLGITVDGVDPVTSAPLSLKPDFQKVTQAASEGQNKINQALSYRNTTIGHATGEKESRIKTAEVEKSRRVGLIGAEATNFSQLLPFYERDPQLTSRELQSDTFKQVWGKAAMTEVLPDMEGRQLRFHLSGPANPLVSTNVPTP